MKTGYELYIQDGLNKEERERAVAFCKEFHKETQADPKKRYWGRPTGGHTSFFRRGTFGYLIDFKGGLVFRRISNTARRFAVVKRDTLKIIGEDCGCPCPQHLGGAKVEWIQKPAMTLFLSVGDAKG